MSVSALGASNDAVAAPANRLERLKGALKSFYSIRINDQWRVIRWIDGEPHDVRIVDYH
jgi:toxin HigB-1